MHILCFVKAKQNFILNQIVAMVWRNQINLTEANQIFALKAKGLSVKEIAKKLNRYIFGIYKILHKDENSNGPGKSTGQPKCTSSRDVWRIKSLATKQNMSVRKI